MGATAITAHVVIDVVEPGQCIGWVALGGETGDALSLRGHREGGKWVLYAGDQDQHAGTKRDLRQAAEAVARDCGATSGTVEVEYEYGTLGRRAGAFGAGLLDGNA